MGICQDKASGELKQKNYNEQNDTSLVSTKDINIKDFTLEKVIGRGGYGKVYLAHKNGSSEIFAIKVMKKDMLEKKNLKLSSINERDILAKMNSPYIVKLHYAFQSRDRLYYVLEFVGGGDLYHRLKACRVFSEEHACIYIAEIVCAIQALHMSHIVYRDLKFENILIGTDGHIKLTDFGISKQDNGRLNSMIGTPEYIAPEIFTAQGHDKSVDWWSMGVILYEMLSGDHPFQDDHSTVKEMASNIVKRDVMPIPDVSSEANDLILKLLSKDPHKRLGGNDDDADEIKAHPFFKRINWVEVENKKHKPVFIPSISVNQINNFDKSITRESVKQTPVDNQLLPTAKYDGFTFVPS